MARRRNQPSNVDEKASAVAEIEAKIAEAERGLAEAEGVVRQHEDERRTLDAEVLELGAEVYRDRVAELDFRTTAATTEAARHRATIVALTTRVEAARQEHRVAVAREAEQAWRQARGLPVRLSIEFEAALASAAALGRSLRDAEEHEDHLSAVYRTACEAAGEGDPLFLPGWHDTSFDEVDFRPVPAHVREAGARARPADHVALTAPRPLVARGYLGDVRALGGRGTEAQGGGDGRRVRRPHAAQRGRDGVSGLSVALEDAERFVADKLAIHQEIDSVLARSRQGYTRQRDG